MPKKLPLTARQQIIVDYERRGITCLAEIARLEGVTRQAISAAKHRKPTGRPRGPAPRRKAVA
jgi:hypothetical protein